MVQVRLLAYGEVSATSQECYQVKVKCHCSDLFTSMQTLSWLLFPNAAKCGFIIITASCDVMSAVMYSVENTNPVNES